MNIQIIGTKKCNTTKKAIRFFKERNVPFYFVDLQERSLSPGELRHIVEKIAPEDLINKDSKAYKKKGYEYMEYDAYEEIAENNMLMMTPVVRNGKEVTVGDASKVWAAWLK